jgi:hypothetical protein
MESLTHPLITAPMNTHTEAQVPPVRVLGATGRRVAEPFMAVAR